MIGRLPKTIKGPLLSASDFSISDRYSINEESQHLHTIANTTRHIDQTKATTDKLRSREIGTMSDPLDDGQTYDCFFKKGDRVLHEAEKRIGRVTRVRWDRELKTFKCEYVSELKVVKVIG